MSRPVRIAIVIAVLAAFQGAAYLVYRAVERSRSAPTTSLRFKGERLRGTESAPPLDGVRVNGQRVAIQWPAARPRVVHFWATWCGPCRTELPGLLALGRDLRAEGIDLVAVAVDDEWEDIRAFFGGEVPAEVVVTDDAAVHKRFGVSTLPDTYLVDRSGALLVRFHGARDWRTAGARQHVLDILR